MGWGCCTSGISEKCIFYARILRRIWVEISDFLLWVEFFSQTRVIKICGGARALCIVIFFPLLNIPYYLGFIVFTTILKIINRTPGSGRTLRIPDEQTPFSTTSKLAATVGTDFVHVYYLSKMAKGHFPEWWWWAKVLRWYQHNIVSTLSTHIWWRQSVR